jgi:DNA transformation protein
MRPNVRKPATPLRVSSGFREFVLGQLADIHGLYARAMFGGIGLYGNGVFFGIVAGDALYLKVDAASRRDYVRAGARPFKPYADRPVTMRYYSVPAEVIEDAATLTEWARRSIAVALLAATSSSRRPDRPRGATRRKR